MDETKKIDSSLGYGIYCFYDCVLKQFEAPFSVEKTKLSDYLRMMVNDVQSRFYGHENDFIVNKIGDYNQTTGEIEQHFIERVSTLDTYIDENIRKRQVLLQTINFLPNGYFKMSDEQKKVIQEKIDEAIIAFVNEYITPTLDVETIKSKLSS